ncbi:MAG: hypothetical protein LBQ43_00665 [Holosporales bacterium]|nr:hypothetical protein [Holosporales bacterium]
MEPLRHERQGYFSGQIDERNRLIGLTVTTMKFTMFLQSRNKEGPSWKAQYKNGETAMPSVYPKPSSAQQI